MWALSSQGCLHCQDEDTAVTEKPGRVVQCPSCGHRGDRDVLASGNLRVAYRHFVATGGDRPAYLCGSQEAMARYACATDWL